MKLSRTFKIFEEEEDGRIKQQKIYFYSTKRIKRFKYGHYMFTKSTETYKRNILR